MNIWIADSFSRLLRSPPGRSSPPPPPRQQRQFLRARAEQFYQLQVDKKFRQAEAFVAEDTKDDYYNAGKPDIKTFEIEGIELLDNNSRARVKMQRKIVVQAPIGVQEFDIPVITTWKLENGQWVWYIEHGPRVTPFGVVTVPAAGAGKDSAAPPAPGKLDLAALLNQVTLDKTSVVLSTSDPAQTVTVSNSLPGSVTLKLETPHLEGIAVELEKTELKAGEKSAIRFRLTGEAKNSGIVRLVVSPLNKIFEISVQSR